MEIEKISMLVNNENNIEGILIKYKNNNRVKYYSEYAGNLSEEDKEDFCILVTRILFSSKCNEKTEFVYPNDKKYPCLSDSILEHSKDDYCFGSPEHALLMSTLSIGVASSYINPVLFLGEIIPGVIATSVGTISSLKGIRDTNKRIKHFGKTARQKFLRNVYAVALGLNLLSTTAIGAMAGYHEFNKTQLEKDIDDFIAKKDDSIENPFDLDIDYSNTTRIELLMTAITENPNLNEEDKNILYSFKKLLQRNPYIDYYQVYEKFASLGIIYTDEKDKDLSQATYDIKDNYIIDYEFINEGDYHQEEISKLAMNIIGSFYDYKNLNNGMKELLIEMYITPDPYDSYQTRDKIIARCMEIIVGIDTLLKAYSTRDFGIIEEHLKEINDSEEDYEGLVKILKDELVTTEQIFDAYDKYTQPKNKEFVKTK